VTDTPATAQPLFKPRAKPPVDGLALVYDVAGFTRFFNQPDAHRYVPRYLNHVTEAMSIILSGGTAYWTFKPEKNVAKPIRLKALPFTLLQRKFLGDGELIIWKIEDPDDPELAENLKYLINRLWVLQSAFSYVLERAKKEIPVAQLPDKIRFSLARGDLYQLESARGDAPEFAGVCLNLASRLVKYCPELSFLASDRVEARDEEIHQIYSRVVATKIRGFPDEIVLANKGDFAKLNERAKRGLFRELASHPGAPRIPRKRAVSAKTG